MEDSSKKTAFFGWRMVAIALFADFCVVGFASHLGVLSFSNVSLLAAFPEARRKPVGRLLEFKPE